MTEPDFAGARDRMVREQVEARGIRDARTLQALRTVPRHRFVDPALAASAYGDHPLPIGHGQTISQPYMVGLMTELAELGADARVLEIGTGSGYQAAVLSRLCQVVFTIERLAPLALAAQYRFRDLAYDNIVVRIGDGTLGWRRFAPFHAILVTAGAPEPPPTLIEQLRPGGRLLVPSGSRASQQLAVLERGEEESGGGVSRSWSVPCTFVPLIGREGWRDGA